MAIVLEKSSISPPPNSLPEFSLPVVFFDLVWYGFPAYGLLFFKFPACTTSSKSYFFDTILPSLKASLSLTLSHFLPLAGNIIHPLIPGPKPILRYQSGDSVPFTVSESTADLNHLTGNQPRSCDEFYIFAPHLPPATHSVTSISCPVLALQVTLFPGQGLCIGFAVNHGVVDASTVVSFFQAWALVNKKVPDDDISALLKEANVLPFYGRNTHRDLLAPLESKYWDLIVETSSPVDPPPLNFPINRLQAIFVLTKDEIQTLKNSAKGDCPRLSSFTVACALAWACLAKSAGEEATDDEAEYFGFVADCRGRLKPPLAPNYFGNCLALVKTELKHGQVKGADGFVMAAKAIGDAVEENVYGEKGVLHGAENWPEEFGGLIGKRQCGVSGSPRFDFYAVDYGWGKPAKFEAVNDGGSMSLSKSRDFEGGLEIGMSLPAPRMDAFARVFDQMLSDLQLK